MGGCDFTNFGKGATAQEAFSALRDRAQHEDGHGGYTGTIAEKHSFIMISSPVCKDKQEAMKLANELLDKSDPRIDDKWGPAGCIPCGENIWLFFGWASS